MAAQGPRYIAGGNISPSRVVYIDQTSGKNFHVLQADANSRIPVGISQDGTWMPPGVAGNDGYAAIAGKTLVVFGNGEECLASAGDTIVQGKELMSDANGKLVPFDYTLTANAYIVGVALESANSGELFRVNVRIQLAPDHGSGG